MVYHLSIKYPACHVTLFDLNDVIQLVPTFLPGEKPANLSLHAGDFFTDPLPPADLYIMSHVVHDWSEDKLSTLLGTVYRSLKPGTQTCAHSLLLTCHYFLRFKTV